MNILNGLAKPSLKEISGLAVISLFASCVVILLDSAYSLGLITIPLATIFYGFLRSGMKWSTHKTLHLILGVFMILWVLVYVLIGFLMGSW